LSKSDGRGRLVRGKSELHRAGCWVIPSEGDLKESATERYRLTGEISVMVRVERWGKSSPAGWRLPGSVNPTWSKTK